MYVGFEIYQSIGNFSANICLAQCKSALTHGTRARTARFGKAILIFSRLEITHLTAEQHISPIVDCIEIHHEKNTLCTIVNFQRSATSRIDAILIRS